MTLAGARLSAVGGLLGVTLLWVGTSSSLGGYVGKVTNAQNTAASAVWGTTCLAQAKTDAAYFFYRLDEAVGLTAVDSTGNARPGTYQSNGVAYRDTAGPCGRDAQSNVITLNGSTGYLSGPELNGAPDVLTEEIWFKTLTQNGGKLFGFGNRSTGQSSLYDRHIFMSNDGRVHFGVLSGAARTISSQAAYNDGSWHHAVATLAPSGTYLGMRLYVDGSQVAFTTAYTSSSLNTPDFVRIGYDNLSAFTSSTIKVNSYWFQGSLADAAFYQTAFTPTQVAMHYSAGK